MFKKILLNLFLTLIIFIAAAAFLGYQFYQATLKTPLNQGENPIVKVEKGDTLMTLARKLKENHGLREPKMVKLWAYLNPDKTKIKSGDYLIGKNMNFLDFLAEVRSGNVIVLQFKVIAGQRSATVLKNLKKAPHINQTLNEKSERDIAEILGIKEGSLEGQFFPDTYNYSYNVSDVDLLKLIHKPLSDKLSKSWENRGDNLSITSPYEALILASIIEKETSIKQEREIISGVFNRRLAKGMRLQTDPTVIYGMGDKFSGVLTKEDLRTDTEYNTYTRNGLPPTPIAIPSEESIWAATHPDNGKSLFFVADGSGGHSFSDNYDDHLKAVEKYRELQKLKKDKSNEKH